MINAKEALMLSLKSGNKRVTELISELEEEVEIRARTGFRCCEKETTTQPQCGGQDINISDVTEYFELLEYTASSNRSQSPFNQAITYSVLLEW